MDLRDYLVLVARHWLVLLGSIAVGLVAAIALLVAATPQYQAAAQVLFTAQDTANGRDLAYAGNYVQSRIQTYKDLATSPAVLGDVVTELDLEESPQGLAGRTEVEVSQLDTVVAISVRDPSADDSARTANAVAEALVQAVTELENSTSPHEESARIDGVVIGEAAAPGDPAHPNKPLYLLAGLFAGLFVGSAVVAVRHVLAGGDDTAAPGAAGGD